MTRLPKGVEREMEFIQSDRIDGVRIRMMKRFEDERGWLSELYRRDEWDHQVALCYVSSTHPGVARGPHEHVYQADFFAFLGPGVFRVYLWDTRKESPTYLHRIRIEAGDNNPHAVYVPPRVVHAYKNISKEKGLVINLPDRLYRGVGKSEGVDEMRYENMLSGNVFVLD